MAALFLILFVSLGLSLARQAAAGRIKPRSVPQRGRARWRRRAPVAPAHPARGRRESPWGQVNTATRGVPAPRFSAWNSLCTLASARSCTPFLHASRRRAPGAPGLGRPFPSQAVKARV